MTAAHDVEASLSPEERTAFDQLLKDYNAAKMVHVPTFPGNISRKIAAQLILDGWRKVPASIAAQ
jgi:hypothetical protein